jgi:hypothetical protein
LPDKPESAFAIDAQTGNKLDGRLDGDTLHGISHFGLVPTGSFFNLGIGGLAGGRRLLLNFVKFALDRDSGIGLRPFRLSPQNRRCVSGQNSVSRA